MAKRKDGYGIGKSEGWDGRAEVPMHVQRKLDAKAKTLEIKQKREQKRTNYET